MKTSLLTIEAKIEEVLGNWSSLVDIWHTLISRIFEYWFSCNLKYLFQQNNLINTLFQIQKTCQNAMLNSILLKYAFYIGTQPIFKKFVKSMSVMCLLNLINCLRLPLSLYWGKDTYRGGRNTPHWFSKIWNFFNIIWTSLKVFLTRICRKYKKMTRYQIDLLLKCIIFFGLKNF